MKITCLTTFLDGTDRFEKGDTRTVSHERGAYFLANGWAADAGTEPAAAPADGDVTINVKNASMGQGAVHG
ncbi:hypothetical protein [Hydrogenophaga sp.]|uniref:hypothetical protein n=1 Tax=Hydrogenophaga sp. TaxID=1904254 RepID=UPI00272FE55F|nr:hypothetical protein [Hydrogenophaga sp.]MDP1686874.1 hypothetical protein [Hydrogenophaga sp.]